MDLSLTNFREEYLQLVLRFLWRQWSALGVAGYADTGDAWAIDPEALLLLTCTMGRYDPRLFDEVIDWLTTNERFINVQRLKSLLEKEGFKGNAVLCAVAGTMKREGRRSKWARLAQRPKDEPEERYLFRLPNNSILPLVGQPDPIFHEYGWLRNPLELRGLSKDFPPRGTPCLWLRLRALFGVNARCEILLYLLIAGRANSSDIARQTHFFQRTIQDALSELAGSGLLASQRLGREKLYWLKDVDKWEDLLGVSRTEMHWICWAPLFAALESIWLCIQSDAFDNAPPMLQMSQLRTLMRTEVGCKLVVSGLNVSLPDPESTPGMEYLDQLLHVLCDTLG